MKIKQIGGAAALLAMTLAGALALNAVTAPAATRADGENQPQEYVNDKSFKVEQKATKGSVTLDNEEAKASFSFGLGTEGQTAEFSNPDYFLTSKVTYGENLTLDGKDNKSMEMTWFGVKSQSSGPDEDNAIRFIIQPNFGFTFTPTKVSFKTTRFGTDGGYLDIAWENPDKSTVSLAKEIKL